MPISNNTFFFGISKKPIVIKISSRFRNTRYLYFGSFLPPHMEGGGGGNLTPTPQNEDKFIKQQRQMWGSPKAPSCVAGRESVQGDGQ